MESNKKIKEQRLKRFNVSYLNQYEYESQKYVYIFEIFNSFEKFLFKLKHLDCGLK